MTPEEREQFLGSPALMPPNGIQSNFVDPPNARSQGSATAQLLLATVFVWMRVFTKARVIRKVLVEDCQSTLC